MLHELHLLENLHLHSKKEQEKGFSPVPQRKPELKKYQIPDTITTTMYTIYTELQTFQSVQHALKKNSLRVAYL
jgi:hypothetical protein